MTSLDLRAAPQYPGVRLHCLPSCVVLVIDIVKLTKSNAGPDDESGSLESFGRWPHAWRDRDCWHCEWTRGPRVLSRRNGSSPKSTGALDGALDDARRFRSSALRTNSRSSHALAPRAFQSPASLILTSQLARTLSKPGYIKSQPNKYRFVGVTTLNITYRILENYDVA